MASKDVPFEKDYKHWKELYEMGERRHATEIEKWQKSALELVERMIAVGHEE